MNVKMTVEEINDMINVYKQGLREGDKKVEVLELTVFLERFNNFLFVSDLINVKLTSDGSTLIGDSFIARFRLLCHQTFNIAFPDGEKWTMVLHYDPVKKEVHGFGYMN